MTAEAVTPWMKMIELNTSCALARYTRAKVSLRLETAADKSALKSAIPMTGAKAVNSSSASSEEVIVPVNCRLSSGMSGTRRMAFWGLNIEGLADNSDGRIRFVEAT